MPRFIIAFNQQWVGDHPEEWYDSRGPLARAVVDDMRAAGVLVVAGGVEEDRTQTVVADTTTGSLEFRNGPYAPGQEYLGGFTVIEVADEDDARVWAGRVAEACGWPQELRRMS
jgi:hypothetical protein